MASYLTEIYIFSPICLISAASSILAQCVHHATLLSPGFVLFNWNSLVSLCAAQHWPQGLVNTRLLLCPDCFSVLMIVF